MSPFLIAPLIATFLAESIKIILGISQSKTLSRKTFFQTGGMPSGHSSFSFALITILFWQKGLASPEFSIAFVFGIIVMYDAVKLRQAVGKHAAELNEIRKQKIHNERIGHTPIEILAGIFLGGITATIVHFQM